MWFWFKARVLRWDTNNKLAERRNRKETKMSVTTHSRQPVVYDMMLLAHALIRLRVYESHRVGIGHAEYCEKQTVFENACAKVRSLAQFISDPKKNDMISITDPEFGGQADTRFIRTHFDVISKYVSHLQEQRWRKDASYPRPKANDILTGGTEILRYLKPLMDGLESQLTGDAARWHAHFKTLYAQI